ncbi:MFS transporter [Propionibacteriaceae bacterium Y1685]
MTASAPTTRPARSRAEEPRVVLATVVGTTVEWYDFFIYAFAAGLVFGPLFFEPAGEGIAKTLAFFTIGISFLFRPLGATLAGHFGDKFGRRVVLVITLIMMGLSTALIGLLPSYVQWGVAAPILLILLRVLQGISAGGECGGAVLMAVEHAPVRRRGIFGAAPQAGVPLGLLLASAMLGLMALIAPGDAFLEWGWRVPFLLSIVLIAVGYWVRRQVEESPVFHEISERRARTRMPLIQLFRRHTLLVIIAAFVFAGNNAVGYMTTGGFIQSYTTDPKGPLALERGPVLWAVAGSAVTWLIFTCFAGWLSDRIGRRTTYLIGWGALAVGMLALFPLVNLGTPLSIFAGTALLTVGLGFTYGPQAALYASSSRPRSDSPVSPSRTRWDRSLVAPLRRRLPRSCSDAPGRRRRSRSI